MNVVHICDTQENCTWMINIEACNASEKDGSLHLEFQLTIEELAELEDEEAANLVFEELTLENYKNLPTLYIENPITEDGKQWKLWHAIEQDGTTSMWW